MQMSGGEWLDYFFVMKSGRSKVKMLRRDKPKKLWSNETKSIWLKGKF